MTYNERDESKWLDFEKFKELYQRKPVEELPNKVIFEIPEPVVSVRLITYNHVPYIRKAIESVLMQETNFPFEILLGDDDSNDGTQEICLEYAESNPDKIRFFSNNRENNILINGRPNHLFQYGYLTFHIRGQYLASCAGDDYWTDKFKLQKQVNYLEENTQFSMVCTNYSIVNEKNEVIKEDGWEKIIKNGSIDHLTILRDFKPKTQTALTRCSAIPEKLPVEIFQCLNEDNFFCAFISEQNDVGYMDYVSTAYRVHSNSIWSSIDEIAKKKMQLNTYSCMKKVFTNEEQQSAINIRISRIRKMLSIEYAKVGDFKRAYYEFFRGFKYMRKKIRTSVYFQRVVFKEIFKRLR